jgi:hypothetical protein
MMQVGLLGFGHGRRVHAVGWPLRCTRSSHPVIPAWWRVRHQARVKAATGTSARPGTWWEHLRERASNGRIPGGADHGART